MIPPGKTSLSRMQSTALEEQHRIEISQDGRVRVGMQTEPLPYQVTKRDDFAGIVRLLDIIIGDDALRGRVQDLMAAAARREEAARAAAPPPAKPPAAAAAAASATAIDPSDIIYDSDAEVEA